MAKARFKKGTNDADNSGKMGGSLPALPVVVHRYFADGNCPPPDKGEGKGDFPVLLLDDGSRVVGNKGQSFDALAKQAKARGQIA